jgi:hypothetical protein
MSGLPPPGSLHVVRTRRLANDTTDTDPASRFDT